MNAEVARTVRRCASRGPLVIRCLFFMTVLCGCVAPPGEKKAQDGAPGRATRHPVSLTLIPPSPVTDRIVLDVRGAVRNDGEATRTFDVVFYLDKEDVSNRLHCVRVEVPAGSAGGVSFRWPTADHPGRHRILLTATAVARTHRAERPLDILRCPVRSTGRIGGAWVGLYHWSEEEGRLWNADIRKMTDADWRGLVRAMHEIGMDVIVLQEVFRNQAYVGKHTIERDGYRGKAFYPSRLCPDRMPIAARDPVEAILSEADAHGMSVFMGVGCYAWFDFTSGSLAWHKRVADELWERYGHHASFYGWYVSEEIAGHLGTDDRRRRELVAFFRAFQAHCRAKAPDKPVMLATNCHRVRQGLDFYPDFLAHCDILCPFGFHRMPADDMTGQDVARLLQRLCDEAGAHLWMDLEVFLFGSQRELYPRPISGLIKDLQQFGQFEKILCYQFPGLLNAPWAALKPGGEATVKLYQDYARYIRVRAKNIGTIPD